MLKILSGISNVTKSERLDSWIERLKQVNAEKQRNKRLAKSLRQAKSIISIKRKSTHKRR